MTSTHEFGLINIWQELEVIRDTKMNSLDKNRQHFDIKNNDKPLYFNFKHIIHLIKKIFQFLIFFSTVVFLMEISIAFISDYLT
jgi:hypothetical protein